MMGSTFIFVILGAELVVTIFVLVMLWRFVKAHEGISRHLLEIARDLKTVSAHLTEKDK